MFLLVCVQEVIFWLCDPSVRSGIAHTWRLFVGETVGVYIYTYVLCVYILLFGFWVIEGTGILS